MTIGLEGAIAEVEAAQGFACALARLLGADTVQRRVVMQVLGDGEVEIERARLEDNAQEAKRVAGIPVDVKAEDADAPLARGEQPRDQ